MRVQLRADYQVPAVERVREAIRQGARSILLNSPTGSGKTVMASALMEMVAAKGNRANFVVDRLSLIEQTSRTFDSYGLDHGVIQASHPRFRPSVNIQVCSIQTLSRRGWPDAAVDMIDEAHVLHQAAKDRIKSKASIVIGLTATPFTKGLAKHFDEVVNVCTTRWLIDNKWLVPYRAYGCQEPDMQGVAVKASGEWDETETSKRALQVVGDVVAEYLKHGWPRKFICSAVDTAHVDELARQFLAAGVNVATYTYKDADEDRAETVEEFRKQDSSITGLITVTAASRGFDVPSVSCVIMARPLRKSLAEHIQLFGRGLRIADNKDDCLVLDHSGNFSRFFGATERFFDHGIDQLDDGKAKTKAAAKPPEEVEPIKCPSCGAIHKPMPACPVCGHEYPRRKSVEHIPGSLQELIAGRHSDALTRNIFPQVAHYVLHTRKRDGDAARRMAQALFKDMTGDFAHAKWEYVVPEEPSREVLNKLRQIQIKWAKGRSSSGVTGSFAKARRAIEHWGESRVGGPEAAA